MSANVIDLSQHFKSRANPTANLLQCFARHRKDPSDVFWLKENAELLNILECCQVSLTPQDTECYRTFYNSLPDRIAFFPQYYRFLTSMALDLEALGMEGNVAEQLCHFVAQQGLGEAELSDLQRAEAMRLLARRDVARSNSNALVARLHGFMEQSARFALPNRKAAYELTHIVFYLSEYGRRDPKLSRAAIQSLTFTGILAHLEENVDLLSEVCIALSYAGQVPPDIWETTIQQRLAAFDVRPCEQPQYDDQYHEYFVANWACAQSKGGQAFAASYVDGPQLFRSTAQPLKAMRAVSQAMFERPAFRRASWETSKQDIFATLTTEVGAHLKTVVAATPEFESFFEHFARRETPAPEGPAQPNPIDRKGAGFW